MLEFQPVSVFDPAENVWYSINEKSGYSEGQFVQVPTMASVIFVYTRYTKKYRRSVQHPRGCACNEQF